MTAGAPHLWHTFAVTGIMLAYLAALGHAASDWSDFYLKYGQYAVTASREDIQVGLADSVADKLGLSALPSNRFQPTPKGGALYQRRPTYRQPFTPHVRFFAYRSANGDSSLAFAPALDEPYAYGFQVQGGGTLASWGHDNLEKFLLSAYLQELSPAHRDTMPFITLPKKDARPFDRRNWLSAGYAMQYAYEDAPFNGNKNMAIGYAYFGDAFTAMVLLVGPITGKTPGDKIGFVATGLIFNLLFKALIIRPLGLGVIESHNAVIESGYKIPEGVR